MLPFEEVSAERHDDHCENKGEKGDGSWSLGSGQKSSYKDPTTRSSADDDGHDNSLRSELFTRVTGHKPHGVAVAVRSNERNLVDEAEDGSSANEAITDQSSGKIEHRVVSPRPEGVKHEITQNRDDRDCSGDHENALVVRDANLSRGTER